MSPDLTPVGAATRTVVDDQAPDDADADLSEALTSLKVDRTWRELTSYEKSVTVHFAIREEIIVSPST